MLQKIAFLFFVVSAVFSMRALDPDNPVERYELRNMKLRELSNAKTSADSIRLLYDAFDLATRKVDGKIGWKLLETARRANNNEVVCDAIRLISNRYADNDSIQRVLMQMAIQLPDNERKKETITFMKMLTTWSNARKMSEKDRQIKLQRMISAVSSNPPSDIFDEVYLLHSVCVYLSQSDRNELLLHYLDKLIEKIDRLPMSAASLKNLGYNLASIHYIDAGDYKNAIKFGRHLLAVTDSLERKYHAEGRIYRSFNDSRYMRYATLMFNYPGMTDGEIEETYAKTKYYAVRDSDALETYTRYESPTINYLMAHKRYAEVIPIIKRQYDDPYNIKRRRLYIRYLIEAATAIDDKPTQLYALKENQKILDDYLNYRSFDRYRELQVLYDVNDLKMKISDLEAANEAVEKRNRMLLIFVTGVIVVAVMLIAFIGFRSKVMTDKLNKQLRQTDSELDFERQKTSTLHDRLVKANEDVDRANRQKTDFVNNMSNDVKVPLQAITEYSRLIVDCVEGDKKNYLERFSNLIEVNSELLSALINDVLNLSELDNSTIHLSCHGADVVKLCQIAADSVRNRLNDGVSINLDINDDVIIASTDPKRVEQVLINLLTNAAKFTDKGQITLACCLDNEKNRVIFTVTDTGIGIAPEKKDVIFDRFVKLNRSAPGAGIGLTVARMVARLLGGDVVLDTSYTRGARFIFTIPVSMA